MHRLNPQYCLSGHGKLSQKLFEVSNNEFVHVMSYCEAHLPAKKPKWCTVNTDMYIVIDSIFSVPGEYTIYDIADMIQNLPAYTGSVFSNTLDQVHSRLTGV